MNTPNSQIQGFPNNQDNHKTLFTPILTNKNNYNVRGISLLENDTKHQFNYQNKSNLQEV